MMLPDDEFLTHELVSVRLRKNSFGVHRLDHDAGLHDDQAVALALGNHWLAEAAAGAEQWIAWARKKTERAEAERLASKQEPAALPDAAGGAAAPVASATVETEPGEDAPLEGVPLTDAKRRQLTRNQAWREQG